MFLNRRWFAFSIQHCFPVRVRDFQNYIVSIIPTAGVGNLSNNAKNDKNFQVFLPPLKFGDFRYFASVCNVNEEPHEATLEEYFYDVIWEIVEQFIPASFLDVIVNVPGTVEDVRHQDSVLLNVKESLLTRASMDSDTTETDELKTTKIKDGKKGVDKEKDKKKGAEAKVKYELRLTGDEILAGAGRVIPFASIGDRPSELGEMIAVISSSNLPAQDDDPIFFVNIENLFRVPVKDLKKLNIGHLYTRWKIGDEEHDSNMIPIKGSTDIKINDHHVIVLPSATASIMVNSLLEDQYEIELRGIKNKSAVSPSAIFFGYDKRDRDYDKKNLEKVVDDEKDFIIGVTKICAQDIIKGFSIFIGGDFSIYPPSESVVECERLRLCTNDLNSIGFRVEPKIIVPTSIILKANMTLEASLGFVGCRPPKLSHSFSRMYALVRNSEIISSILMKVSELNKELANNDQKEAMLTGLAIDTGDVVFLYIEGPRYGKILNIWEMTEDFYPAMKPLFSNSARFLSRLYPDLLLAATPVKVYKMSIPLCALLACPYVYVRPALPLPTRSAVLKIGRLLAKQLKDPPNRSEMLTSTELRSFKLELCVPPRSTPAPT